MTVHLPDPNLAGEDEHRDQDEELRAPHRVAGEVRTEMLQNLGARGKRVTASDTVREVLSVESLASRAGRRFTGRVSNLLTHDEPRRGLALALVIRRLDGVLKTVAHSDRDRP